MNIRLFGRAPEPNEVFTPRSPDINQKTYVERPTLERRLVNALKGDKYIIVHGESGNGKTWLYKRVLSKANVAYEVINLSNLHTAKSLTGLFTNKLGDLGSSQQVTAKTEGELSIKPAGMGGGLKQIHEYEQAERSAFARLAHELGMRNQGRRSVLVLDNFEQIMDENQYVREVASLIISADETSIANSGVLLLIVGTPINIKQMIAKVSNATTISNRVIEIPEVARLELDEAYLIMSQGFERHLKLTFVANKNDLYKRICWNTDRIAQHIQELCLKVALIAQEKNNVVTQNVIEEAEKEWIEESLSADLGVVEQLMNAQRTNVGRKNQVLYCLGQHMNQDFKYMDVENVVRSTFKVSPETNLNVPQILATFVKADNPLLRRTETGQGYRFTSPKLRMVLRTIFKLDTDNKVIKVH